jgi:hypothetical protein
VTHTVCQFCNATHAVAVPTVHLIGTSGQDLLDQFTAAVEALRIAHRSLAEATPNGRDYYPQGASATQLVMDQHERRCQDLHRILAELEEMRNHVEALLEFQAEQRAAREVR